MEEIWKDIEGYEGYYQVSNLGRVKSLERIIIDLLGKKYTIRERILKECKDTPGYLYVILSKNNMKKSYRIHRLVAETFIENPINYPCINHKDENKTNNNINNLEWCTCKYNTNYGTCIERSAYSKSKPIAMLKPTSYKFIKSFLNSRIAAEQMGLTRRNINYCCNNNYYFTDKDHLHKGYIWVFLDQYINNPKYPITS